MQFIEPCEISGDEFPVYTYALKNGESFPDFYDGRQRGAPP
jgi:hypothetical protein